MRANNEKIRKLFRAMENGLTLIHSPEGGVHLDPPPSSHFSNFEKFTIDNEKVLHYQL